MKMKMPPSRHEPEGRRVVETPAHWRSRVAFSMSVSFLPFYAYRQLDGVTWDCPACGTAGSVVLREYRHEYWFFCAGCGSNLYNFYTPDAEALSAEVGAGSFALT